MKLLVPFLIIIGILCPPLGVIFAIYWIMKKAWDQPHNKQVAMEAFNNAYGSEKEEIVEKPLETCNKIISHQNGMIEVYQRQGLYRVLAFNDKKDLVDSGLNFHSFAEAKQMLDGLIY